VAGYEASARIRTAGPRFAGAGRRPASFEPWPGPIHPENERVELVGRPIDERLAAWWADLRGTCVEATFFLFDPESWR